MKERPILFSGPMVRAILEGRKTQTRRVVKFKHHHTLEERDDGSLWPWFHDCDRDADVWAQCPYGQPGDLLWVKEAWRVSTDHDDLPPRDISAGDDIEYVADLDRHGYLLGTLRSSIFMPRWASRITLEVKRVRVERLQGISIPDAIAEGCPGGDRGDRYASIDQYRMLWESLNGPGSWDANPFVWVVEFERIDARKKGTL